MTDIITEESFNKFKELVEKHKFNVIPGTIEQNFKTGIVTGMIYLSKSVNIDGKDIVLEFGKKRECSQEEYKKHTFGVCEVNSEGDVRTWTTNPHGNFSLIPMTERLLDFTTNELVDITYHPDHTFDVHPVKENDNAENISE